MATSVSDFAKAFGVDPNTIRHWGKQFSEFLSPGANPGRNEERRYTAGDEQVIALIGELRAENRPYEAIRAALAAGDRGQWPPDIPAAAQDEPGQAGTPGTALSIREQRLTATVAHFEGELGAIREERDHLRGELASEREARIEAEKRAAHMAGRLEELEKVKEEEKPTPRSLWRRLTGRE